MFYPHQFTGSLRWRHMGKTLNYSVVDLPPALAADLPFDGPRLRIEGEIDGVPFEAALMPDGGGGHYLMTPSKMLKKLGKTVGDSVTVAFGIADPNAVPEPPELRAALDELPDLRMVWDGLTPGKRRGLVHGIATAKRPETRIKRVGALIDQLADGV